MGSTFGSVCTSRTGSVGGQRLVPGCSEVVGVGDGDGLQAEAGGEAREVDVGQGLGLGELRRPLHGPQLPGDLVELVIVQDGDDQARVAPLLPVVLDGDQLGHAVHLHRAVADDGHDRHVVELGVVEAVEQVDGARAGGGHADPDPAGELGVADRFERAHLLVPRLHEHRVVARSGPRGEDPIDAVAREGEDMIDAPVTQTLQQVVGHLLCCHGFLLPS